MEPKLRDSNYQLYLKECGLTTLENQKIERREDTSVYNIEWL